VILTGRFTKLRPLVLEDAQTTLCWRLSSRARFLQRGAETVEKQRDWIASAIVRREELNFVIEYMTEAVGMIALTDINRAHKTAVMGRELIGEVERTGQAPVAFEAELLICDYVFDTLGFHKIWGDVMEDNTSMLLARRYLGYKEDGLLRDHYLFDDCYKNTVVFSLLEDEYRATCRPKLVQLIDLFSRYSVSPSAEIPISKSLASR
jgi:RimJ/RimL family protein N-acetyltransferase